MTEETKTSRVFVTSHEEFLAAGFDQLGTPVKIWVAAYEVVRETASEVIVKHRAGDVTFDKRADGTVEMQGEQYVLLDARGS